MLCRDELLVSVALGRSLTRVLSASVDLIHATNHGYSRLAGASVHFLSCSEPLADSFRCQFHSKSHCTTVVWQVFMMYTFEPAWVHGRTFWCCPIYGSLCSKSELSFLSNSFDGLHLWVDQFLSYSAGDLQTEPTFLSVCCDSCDEIFLPFMRQAQEYSASHCTGLCEKWRPYSFFFLTAQLFIEYVTKEV